GVRARPRGRRRGARGGRGPPPRRLAPRASAGSHAGDHGERPGARIHYAGMLRGALPRLAVLLAACAVAGCSSGGGAVERAAEHGPAVPVHTAIVVQKEAPVILPAIGTVRAYSTVEVRAQVEGRLADVHFAEG